MDGHNQIYFKPDVINRQDVNNLVDELARAISYERSFMSIGRSTGEIMHDILNLPSVTPQPNVGHWIPTGSYYKGAYGNIEYVKCSRCHEYRLEKCGYCPDCGAKMVELQESEGMENK